MDQNMISRIDRAVADNIKDIQRSFGGQAGLVQDFIVFISRRLKADLFGYTRFTMQDFCKHTGRRRQELAMIHPDFSSGKLLAPVIEGFAFHTVFDYALYSMMERNIIFSARYEVKQKDQVLQMHNFPILKDLKLNFARSAKDQKIYDIRVSDELMSGFLSRYYTLNAESYKLVGKGRGGDSRKKLLLYLSKLSHVVQTSGIMDTLIPLNRLCEFADISDPRPSHKKQNLSRMMDYIRDTGQFAFNYEFVNKGAYVVKLVFHPVVSKRQLQIEHTFYYRLLSDFRSVYAGLKKTPYNIGEQDPFQSWLSDIEQDTALKAQLLTKAYYIALNINISLPQALEIIRSRQISRPFSDVR